jgi:hypothetical protein
MDIIKKVRLDAERKLKSLRASYYIKLSTGEEYSHGMDGYEVKKKEATKPAEPEKAPRVTRTGAPFGALIAYYKPYLEGITKAGDIAEIPFGDYKDNPEYLRGAISAYCTQSWGRGTYTSVMNRIKGQVEVLRLKDASDEPPADKATATEAKTTGGGTNKFRTVGHGMDALSSLHLDAYDDDDQTHNKP